MSRPKSSQGNQLFSQENWIDGVVWKFWGEAVLTGKGARFGFWKRKPKVGLSYPLPACLYLRAQATHLSPVSPSLLNSSFGHPQDQDVLHWPWTWEAGPRSWCGLFGQEILCPSNGRAQARPSKAQAQSKNLVTQVYA